MKRRVLALLLALVMLLGSIPAQAFAAEELGLPIHFFVSTLEEAQDPYGDYQNYKQSSWGSGNGTAGAYAVANVLELAPSIATQQGIRAHMAEEDILKYVAQWPNGGTADDFRKFDGSIRIGGTNYSGDEYEIQWVTICKRDSSNLRCYCGVRYEHIHIDGILTKKIQITPGTMNLTKEISAVQSEDQTFTFKLYQLALDGNYDPTNQTIGSGPPMFATIPAGSTTATIKPVDPSATFGFGYYKLVEDPNDVWKPSSVKIGNSTNKQASELYICIHTDGSVQYSTTYNTGYRTASSATVVNTLRPRADIKVTKVWADHNDQDGIRPESITVHLLKNNEHVGTPVTLNAANNWSASWNVPLEDKNGNTIAYHVEEVVPNGYTGMVTGNAADGFVITNTHIVERTNVQVQKVWHDDNDRDGIRPHGVVVQLYKNGQPVTSYTDHNGNPVSGTATLTAANAWAHQWLDLEKNAGGAANAYTVQEIGYVNANGQAVTNPGYTVGYDSDETGRLVVENTYQVATMDIPVQKVWNDENNRDGIRPTSVTVTLYADGISTGKTLTLNASNNWRGVFEDVYVNSAGIPVVYSVAEDIPTGYTFTVSGTAAGGFTVTNTHTPETIAVPVNKIWNDAEDQDGLRPDHITVALYADGIATGDTLNLSKSSNWTGSFTGVAKFKAGAVGTAIVYTVQEVTVPTGYTPSYNGTTVTNTHAPITADLSVHKIWKDFGDNDGMRADSVTVTLYANGIATGKTLTLNESNGWTGTWQDIPRYQGGQRINYTVLETGYTKDSVAYTGIPQGYSVDYSYSSTETAGTATVTNSYTPATIGLNIQKVWDDNDNREGLRPASVTVTLYQQIGNGTPTVVIDSDGNPVTAVLSVSSEWEADFVGLPKMANRQPITYSVVETPVAGYTTGYSAIDENNVLTITNTHAINQNINVTAAKVWDDADNQDAIRPASVTLTLYANGIKTSSSITLDGIVDANGEAEAWKATWSGLYEYYRGKKIVYTVAEETVPEGYRVSVTGSNNNYTVTNTHTPATVSVPVTKVWNDANDQDGKRPASITVKLYANGAEAAVAPLTLSEANNWTAAFENLPQNAAGTAITYTVKEVGEENGKVTYNSAEYAVVYDQTTHTITNTYTPETVSMSVEKVWNDSNATGVVRPTSVTVHLLANGVHTEMTAVLSDSNWTYTWNDLPKYADGMVINYTVFEEMTQELVEKGYSASYTYTGNHVTVTNTRSLESTSFTVQKIWNDTLNQDNIRPASIQVQLFADGAAVGSPVTLNADGHWRTTWSNLQKYRTGSSSETIEYTVKEIGLPAGYTAAYGIDPHTGIYTVTNTHEVEKTSVTVTKVWNDADNQDGIRPDSVAVTLYRNGVATTTTATLNAANGWTYTFTGLDVHHGIGVDNVYTVVESGVPEGYISVTTGNAADGYVITNTHVPEVVSVTTSKNWVDGNDQDGLRPDNITVALYADGVATGDTIVLDPSNNWTSSFNGLPKYKAGSVGQAVVYSVKEVDVPDGYLDTYNGTVITNTHTPETADLSVKKLWNDFGNNDGVRPFAIEVTLYQNGQATDNKLILNADNNWTGVWQNMPRYHVGQRISYTVVETGYYQTEGAALTPGVPDGYTVTHDYDYTNAIAYITNSYTPETTSLNVQKIWDDEDNRDGKRPASVTVTLWRKIGDGTWHVVPDASGNPITATMSSENEWDVSFTGLPKYNNGQEIIYNAVEEQVDGYLEPVYQFDTASRIVTITNKRNVDRVTVTGTKVWNDADNQDGIRPETVVLTLYANGIKTSSTITLDGTVDANGETAAWVATWSNLLKNYHGVEIVYTVVEEAVADGYTVGYARSTDAASHTACTITNTHVTDVVTIPVSKIWDDADDQDAIRPAEIKVTLYANDTAVATLMLKASENWTGSFGTFPVNEDGTPITYTVKEAPAPGYTAAYSTDDSVEGTLAMQIKNTHVPYQTTMTVTKVWDDNNDQDGKRPDSIVVHLLANGEHTGLKVTLTADMNWTYTWTGLDKFVSGQEITYMVFEEPVYFKDSVSRSDRSVDTYFANYARNPEDPTHITITNSYTPETTVITAMKIWDDDDNRDNLRTESVTAELFADGVTTGKTVVLNKQNEWVASWENLPKYKDHGKEIVYSVVENNVPTGYTVTIAQESEYAPGLFIISNTHTPALTSVTVQKAWDDDDNNDAIRPVEISVTLLCNGEKLYTVTLSEQTNWTYTWTGLYKYADGKEAVYTVEEAKVDGYTATYTKSSDENGYIVWTVTNTHEVKTTELVVTTVWVDDNNSHNTRPKDVPAQLYKDGEPYGDVFDVTVEKDWQTTIIVPVFEDGKEIVWTVKQVETPNPYTVTYNQGKLTIINTALFDDAPATGDDFNPMVMISLMTASLAGIVVLFLSRKKKRSEA